MQHAPVNVLIFGATGTAGGSVLNACLSSPWVREVRSISRRPLRIEHPKLRTYVHADYLDYAPVREAFVNVDLCLFCLGISVSQVSGESEYRVITHDFAIAASKMLRAQSPQAVFHYLSGQGASLRSWFMWARVKAETEAELLAGFDAVCWRPASIDGADSENAPRLYQAIRPLFRLLKPFRSLYIQGEDIGRAMLQAHVERIRKRTIGNAGMRALADRAGIVA